MSEDMTAAIAATPEISLKVLEDSLVFTLQLWCPRRQWSPRITGETPEKALQSCDRFLTHFPSLGFETLVQAILYELEKDEIEDCYMNRISSDQTTFEVLSGEGYIRGKKGRGKFAVLAIIAAVARCGHGLIIDSGITWMEEHFDYELYDLDYVDNWIMSLVAEIGFKGVIERFDRCWV